MPLVLDLRERLSHAGVPLVHPTSEHVVLANVFGTLKNFSADAAINPWVEAVTCAESVRSDLWKFGFWEKQPRPIGVVGEGSTEVDLVLESDKWLVFLEVKMDAQTESRHQERPRTQSTTPKLRHRLSPGTRGPQAFCCNLRYSRSVETRHRFTTSYRGSCLPS